MCMKDYGAKKSIGKIRIIHLIGQKLSFARREHMLMYENIDMERTGILLKELFDRSGYTVKDIQKILHLSCPQPIYRWFKGSILPSVDHLYVLSRLLKIHMEDLLVPKCEYSIVTEKSLGEKRLYEYWKRLCIKKCA